MQRVRQVEQSIAPITAAVSEATKNLTKEVSYIDSKIKEIAAHASDWLRANSKMIKNKSGDIIIISEDGMRRIRFDIYNPFPHKNPHGHVEKLVDGSWIKSGPIYPIDLPHK